MKNFAKKSETSTASRRAFALNPVAAGCALLLSALGGNVYAQDAAQPAPQTQEAQAPAPQETAAAATEQAPAANQPSTVVVTGIRRGIEAAISIKKNSTSIVEAISAEDIGKLPDQSVAESISRLPGVTVQRGRSSGKASEVSVRGLSPSFNGTLLNGRETASTGNARSPEFDLFPSELMGSVVIYKTPDASVVGQGLAATIDLRTVQPLDFAKRTIAVNYKKSRLGVKQAAGLPEGDGDRYSLSYVDQFANRTIGVAIGLTRYEEMGGGQSKFNSWGGWAADFDDPRSSDPNVKVKTPGGFGFDTEQGFHNRDGAFASLQFRPNRNFKSTLDLFYSAGDTGLKKTGIEAAVGGNSAGNYDPAGELINATYAGNVATSGTITNWTAVVRNHMEAAEDDFKTIGWNNELKIGDWTTAADLTYSKATKLASRYETYAGVPGNAAKDTITYSGFDGANFADVKYTSGLNYADRNVAKLTDVMGWSGGTSSPQAGYLAKPEIRDEVKSVRLTAKKEVQWGPVVASTYGFNYTARDKARTGDEGRLMIKGGDPYGAVTMPGSETMRAGNSPFVVASWDPRGSLGTIYELANKVDADIFNKFWDVEERVSTGYFMGDLDGEMFGLSYRGNVGVQVVHTDQKGGGYTVDRSRCTGNTAATCPALRVEEGDKYWDVLPSLNMSFDLKNDQVLRLGLAKVLSRANLDDMRGGLNFSTVSTGEFELLGGTGGNPHLKPFRAKAFDLSYEKYFGNKGYVSVAGFYKHLDTYIYRSPQAFDFAPYVTPTTVLPDDGGPFDGSTQGLLTVPRNGNGGKLYGIEVAVNVPFSMLTPMLDGFGVMVNHSDTRSGIELPEIGFANVEAGDKVSIPLPGLSRKVTNMRLYYEAHGFQIAAAARKRSDFLGTVSDYQDNQQLIFIKGETIVDLQASYEFQRGWLKGLSVFAQAQNWNNAAFQEYTVDRNKVTNRVDYGRTYHFGANYKF
jgi:iron complex outermembrane receptor protein